jgi:hypothetical protein
VLALRLLDLRGPHDSRMGPGPLQPGLQVLLHVPLALLHPRLRSAR